MEILDQTEACFAVDEDLLNFIIEDEDFSEGGGASASSSSLEPSNPTETTPPSSCVTQNGSFHEFIEEDLEWLSNKDAFPTVETCFGVLSDTPNLARNQQSPASVIDNNGSTGNSGIIASCCGSVKIPVRARGKRRRRISGFGIFPSQQFQETVKNKQEPLFSSPPLLKMKSSGADIGRRCLHCQSDTTPQWRAGPMGPKTLCNACGVRYKSGRLVPEYRPANSPTFSNVLHSNSHRKVVEMRRKKQLVGGGEMMPSEISGYYNIGI